MRFSGGILAALTLSILAAGCSSDATEIQTKRNHDRTFLRMSEAEAQRDQLKAMFDKTEDELAVSQKRLGDSSQEMALLRKQIQDLQQTINQLTTENDKLKREVARLSTKLPAGTR